MTDTRRDEEMLAMNEALVLAALHQHELAEAAERLNAQLLKEIAERKQAEANLRESEAALRDLNAELERKVLEGSRRLGHDNLVDAIESLDHRLALYDSDDRLVLFNRHLYDQYPQADRYFVVGRTFERIWRDLIEAGAKPLPPGQAAEQFIAARVARHRRADGTVTEEVQADGRVLHISEHRSQSGGYVSIARDVTRQLRLGEQLREAQKMEAIGRLTGGLAHDLNNYLAVIIGNLDLLAELPPADEAALLIEGAIGGALRGAELTRSLLAFSRRQPLAPKVIDLGKRVAGMTKMLRRTIGENIVVELDAPIGLWPVRIDGTQLDTCIVNLANNARDAMPDGGRLSIALSNVLAADEDAMEQGAVRQDHVLIEFADTGRGMSHETLGHVFEPFFTTKGPGHGTGLGLSMVHGFVHQSEGTILVESIPGNGTVVRVRLPRASEQAGGPAASSKTSPMLPGHERILLVEDNEHVRATAAGQLAALGYEVIAAENGDRALALLEENGGGVDMVFSDIMMPGRVDGLELARIVRGRWPDMPVLLTSGFSGGEAAENDAAECGTAVLRKPYRKDDLARAVRGMISR